MYDGAIQTHRATLREEGEELCIFPLLRQRPDDVVTLDDINVESAPHWLKWLYDEIRIIEHATVFRRFRKEMGTILDIGAHWGYSGLSIRRAGTDCPIVSFEALEAHRACLEEFKKFDNGGYDYLIMAVSDNTKTVTLYGPVVIGEAVTGLNSVDGTAQERRSESSGP